MLNKNLKENTLNSIYEKNTNISIVNVPSQNTKRTSWKVTPLRMHTEEVAELWLKRCLACKIQKVEKEEILKENQKRVERHRSKEAYRKKGKSHELQTNVTLSSVIEQHFFENNLEIFHPKLNTKKAEPKVFSMKNVPNIYDVPSEIDKSPKEHCFGKNMKMIKEKFLYHKKENIPSISEENIGTYSTNIEKTKNFPTRKLEQLNYSSYPINLIENVGSKSSANEIGLCCSKWYWSPFIPFCPKSDTCNWSLRRFCSFYLIVGGLTAAFLGLSLGILILLITHPYVNKHYQPDVVYKEINHTVHYAINRPCPINKRNKYFRTTTKITLVYQETKHRQYEKPYDTVFSSSPNFFFNFHFFPTLSYLLFTLMS
ncbi:hypothetical protein SNEBB_004970 [Seison nebaliae]|nr:hypothetical protein SNEBB_004970 [Seison nebaliae]